VQYCGPNTYPDDELPTLRPAVDELYDCQDRMAEAMLAALAQMWELPPRTFAQHFSWRSSSSLRLLLYPGTGGGAAGPPREEGDGAGLSEEGEPLPPSGITPHTDFEMFTLMSQDSPGLQIIPADRNLSPPGGERAAGAAGAEGRPAERLAEAAQRVDGGWIDLPVRNGEFVIIVGDMLERFTNGVLRATPHRVVPTAWPRRSIIRFVAVDGATIVRPLPEFVPPGTQPRSAPLTLSPQLLSFFRGARADEPTWCAQIHAGGAGAARGLNSAGGA